MTCLDMETLIRYYHPSERGQLPNDSAWYLQHPQQLLPPPRWARDLLLGVLDWCKYDDEQGFIGFGYNLIHLNPGLLGLQVNVPAQEGECCLFMPWHTTPQQALGTICVVKHLGTCSTWQRRLQSQHEHNARHGKLLPQNDVCLSCWLFVAVRLVDTSSTSGSLK